MSPKDTLAEVERIAKGTGPLADKAAMYLAARARTSRAATHLKRASDAEDLAKSALVDALKEKQP